MDILYIAFNYWIRLEKHPHNRRLFICETYLITLQLCLLLDVDPGVFIGFLICYGIMNLWDALLTNCEWNRKQALDAFHLESSKISLPTETDLMSMPTMKKLISNTCA